jgi:hypothetical protein
LPQKCERLYYIHISFHDGLLGSVSNITVITATILEAVILVLVTYGVWHLDGFMWYATHTKFHEDSYRCWSNIKGYELDIWKAVMLVLQLEEIY